MLPLPIDAVLPLVLAALRAGPAVVLEAPPGAGKTTRVPPALLDLVKGEVVVLEPRRLAARLAARRVAEERGERVGETVGYQVRFEDVSSQRTRLRFVTEGILARRLLGDPELRGVGAVVLDEFHERHLQGDVALALLQRLQLRRPELKLVVMSATLDAAPLAAHLGCPIVRSEGRRFPVEVEFAEKPDERRIGEQVAAAVRKLTVPGAAGDTLVFLPGAAEIRYATEACAELARQRDLLLLPLHGELAPEEQDRALARARQRKVILSTNVAETSVTIDGVTAVVDSGLARVASHSPWSGLPSLRVEKISQASAAQRAGRAGRTAPGRALRLYTRHDHDTRPEHQTPELLRLDLAETILELRAQGIEPLELPWLDPPPAAALGAAEELLRRLGTCDRAGGITKLGRACVRFPLHPRLARVVLEADARGFGADGCTLAALLGERDLRSARDLRDARAPTGPSDLLELLELFDAARARSFSPGLLRELGVDAGGARRVDRARAQLARVLANKGPEWAVAPARRDESLQIAVLAGFPDRVAKRRAPGGSEVVLAAGGTAQLAPSSVVREAPLLVAVDVQERSEGGFRSERGRSGVVLRLASAIEPEWLLDLFADDLRDEVELHWEEARGRVEVYSRLRYDALVLEETRRLPNEGELPRAAELLYAHARGAQLLDPAALAQLRARTELIAAHVPEAGLHVLTERDIDEALRALCEGRSALAELSAEALGAALVERLGPGAQRALATLAPEQVSLPGGRKLQVEYASGQPPAVHSRLQDFFGSARGPAVAQGRVPLTLHLLAPNGRAQQVTSDLSGFWVRHYPAVRRELMRRYPRHPWPEDGATATPPIPKPPRR